MNPLVRFRPEAEDDARETRDWYESRREGLGTEFRMELDTTIEQSDGLDADWAALAHRGAQVVANRRRPVADIHKGDR